MQFLTALQLYVVGKSIETVEIAGATNADLAEMMVGRSVSFKNREASLSTKRSGLVY